MEETTSITDSFTVSMKSPYTPAVEKFINNLCIAYDATLATLTTHTARLHHWQEAAARIEFVKAAFDIVLSRNDFVVDETLFHQVQMHEQGNLRWRSSLDLHREVRLFLGVGEFEKSVSRVEKGNVDDGAGRKE